jgi:translation initiation factor 4B
MPPKKAKKISLNEFLGDSTGSWADEMDQLPSAPAMRSDDDSGRQNDRYGRRGDDFLSSRPDRALGPPREDVPLPTQPPYTAFVGNLAFDLTEAELEDFFATSKPKSVKIIKDRDDKPKGFGYVEFEDLDGLKDAIAKTGTSFSGRTIRVSVAEPPKERSGFGGNDDSKFDSPWRRDGPLPDRDHDSSRRRFDGPRPEPLPSVSENAGDWRSSRPRAAVPEPETPTGSMRKKTIGFGSDNAGAADREDNWSKGSKFKPAEESAPPAGRFGSRGRGDMGPPRDPAPEESDWRGSSRTRPSARENTSPTGSTPPTPQMGRRKLELLPKSGSASSVPSPLSSPKIGARSANPFGAAKPVDVTARENEVTQKLEKDRELNRDRLTMSRNSSRTGIERPPISRGTSSTTPPTSSQPPASPPAPAPKTIPQNMSANVRPSFSFASAAAKKKSDDSETNGETETTIAEKLGEVTI